jgi:hypothetical protein
MKNVTYDTQKSDTCNYKKLKACTCNFEKPYDESCKHESYYHEILETYTNKFDTMKWAKSIPESALSIWAQLGQSNQSSPSTSHVRFCSAFCHPKLHVWSCSVFAHAKVFLPSKLSYLLFFSSHKTKTGIAMRSETTNNNSHGPIRLCGQWRGGVRLDSREKVR